MAEIVDEVERKIHFFSVHTGIDKKGKPIPFDSGAAFKEIEELEWTADQRYWEMSDGNAICCWVEPKNMRRVSIAIVRRRNLPQIEKAGNLNSLMIDKNAGLAERTHVVFFPDNIMGCEFNYYGPRASKLKAYLRLKSASAYGLDFRALLRDDVAKRLKELDDVRFMKLKVHTAFATKIEELNKDLGSALNALGKVSKAATVEIVLRPAARSGLPLGKQLLTFARKAIGLEGLYEEASQFQLTGMTEGANPKLDTVDLLSDALIAKKTMLKIDTRGRAVLSKSAFEAIEAAYREHRADLVKAASVSLVGENE